MLPYALTAVAVLLLAAVGLCVALWVQKKQLDRDLAAARQALREAEARVAELDKHRSILEETHRNDEQRLKEFKEQIENHLEALASKALKESRKEFLDQASEQFKPIREVLEKYNVDLKSVEKARSEAYAALKQQLESMSQGQQKLKDETANLVTALRRPEVRGRWGEMQLRRVVELAGMVSHCDFKEQVSISGSEGERLRPDMIVHLPGGREIVVDAKTPLDAYIDAIEAAEPDDRLRQLERHAEQVETQIRNLASKGYAQQFEHAPDFVVLFIPGESFLQAAVQQRPQMIEHAMEKGVVIATPSTLISLLHAVAIGWREERLAENAQRISEQGRLIHERLCVFASHLVNLRKAIAKTVEHHDKAIASLDTRVVPAVKELEDLHAKSAKTWPTELGAIKTPPSESKLLADPADEDAA